MNFHFLPNISKCVKYYVIYTISTSWSIKKDSTIHKQWDQIICMYILTESKDSFQNPLSIKEKNNNWNPVV